VTGCSCGYMSAPWTSLNKELPDRDSYYLSWVLFFVLFSPFLFLGIGHVFAWSWWSGRNWVARPSLEELSRA
jgi:hypothetical protein